MIGYYKSRATLITWFQLVADPKNTDLGVIFPDFHVQRPYQLPRGVQRCPEKPAKTATFQFLTFEPESRLH